MDSIKSYIKTSKPTERAEPGQRRPSKQVEMTQTKTTNDNGESLAKRISRRMSLFPSTPTEPEKPSTSEPEFTTFETLSEKRDEESDVLDGRRFSKFTFNSAPSGDVNPEDIEQARHDYRMSMTGNYNNYRRKTMMTHGTEMSDIMEVDSEADILSTVGDSIMTDMKDKGDVNVLEELRHEIMVNYLFQQQCARLWIADGTGEVEGVMLRKSRGNYLACPPALADSVFADACVELNVQVSLPITGREIPADNF